MGPSDSAGSGTSSSLAEQVMPGETVIARIAALGLPRFGSPWRPQMKLWAPVPERQAPERSSQHSCLRRMMKNVPPYGNENRAVGVVVFGGQGRHLWTPSDVGDGQSRKATFPR